MMALDWMGSKFCGFDGFLLLVVVGARNELRSILPTLVLTPLKTNTQFVCRRGCTLLNSTQIILNHLLTQLGFLKACSQIGNLLLKLDVLFDSMERLPLIEPHTSHRGDKTLYQEE
jgi:hypothetical protein